MISEIAQVIVEISEDTLCMLGLDRLDESRWVPAPQHSGYALRIDAARPEMRQRRHVHIARSKQTGAKQKQVNWNDDGTRHDKKSFNVRFQNMPTAKEIARDALGLDPSVILEAIDRSESVTIVVESTLDEALAADANIANTVCLRLRAPIASTSASLTALRRTVRASRRI